MVKCLDEAKINQGGTGILKSACIIDPSNNKVLSCCADMRHNHPLQHAAMLAIDLVAKSQGGGAWQSVQGEA